MAEGEEGTVSFRDGEAQLGDAANHEMVGKLMLMKSNVLPELVGAVGSHHTVSASSDPLHCLLNLVYNLSKDLGLGYLPEEKGMYAEPLLANLGISLEDVDRIRDQMREEIVPELKQVVELCLSS